MLRFLFVILGLLASLATPSAKADSARLWKEVAGWGIYVDPSLNNGCFMLSAYESGTVFRIGFDMTDGPVGYAVIGNSQWRSIERGKDYVIEIKFDREPSWTVMAEGYVFGDGDLTFLWFNFDNMDFFAEFFKKHSMRVFYDGSQIEHLTLRGTYRAGEDLIVCQADQMKSRGFGTGADDPFARPNGGFQYDPFAQ